MDNESNKSNQSVWSEAKFAGEMVRSADYEPRALEKFPSKIDLENSAFAKICDEMLKETLADSKKREHMRYAIVTHDKKIKIPRESIVGSEYEVSGAASVVIRKSIIDARYDKTEQVVFNIHTHGAVDVPPSPQDLSNLLLDPEEGGMMAEIIVTPSSRFLIMRSLQTEPLNEAEARKFSKEETDRLKDYDRHMARFSATADLYSNVAIQRNMKVVLDVCREKSLKLYVALGTSNNYVEVKS